MGCTYGVRMYSSCSHELSHPGSPPCLGSDTAVMLNDDSLPPHQGGSVAVSFSVDQSVTDNTLLGEVLHVLVPFHNCMVVRLPPLPARGEVVSSCPLWEHATAAFGQGSGRPRRSSRHDRSIPSPTDRQRPGRLPFRPGRSSSRALLTFGSRASV